MERALATHAAQSATRARTLLAELPAGVTLVAAAKGQPLAAVRAVVEAGVADLGHNYVQDLQAQATALGGAARWHFIGHLQRRKAKAVAETVALLQTVDRLDLASELDRRCAQLGRELPILIEVNSGREAQKSGALPERCEELARALAGLPRLRLRGLMTMGPWLEDPAALRPYFRETAALARHLAGLGLAGASFAVLSMGMSGSWRVAIEEGATMIRVGTEIFGPRPTS